MEIKKIAVIGAGTMGNGIAQVAAMAGYDVIMRDIEDGFVDRGLETIKRSLEAELYFYSKVFGFKLTDPVEPVQIENL